MNSKLKILYGTNGIFVIAGALLGPLYAVFAESFSASTFTISLTWATLLAASLLTYYIIFRVTNDNAYINMNLIILGYAISAIAWLLFALSTEIYQIFIIQAILGVGLAIGGPSWGTLVAKHLDKDKNVHDYAEWNIFKKVIEIIAVLSGGAIIADFGFTTVFVIMSLIGWFAATLFVSMRGKLAT